MYICFHGYMRCTKMSKNKKVWTSIVPSLRSFGVRFSGTRSFYKNSFMIVNKKQFFFSASGRHTRLTCDWSSDVCSSDLVGNPTKPYDGNTNATLTSANFSLSGLAGTESFTVTKTTGNYNDPNVGLATTVSTTLAPADFTPGAGTSANNYTLPTSASGAGSISKKTLTASIVGNPTRPYDGNTNATLTPGNFSLSGLVGTESFTVTKTTGSYNDANVALATIVSTTLTASDFTA